MKITALLPARNEDWIFGFSLRALLMWADEVVILLHSCSDRTREITEQIQQEVGGDRLILIENDDPVWRDTDQRQFLLEAGRHRDSEHFAILDADEVLTGTLLPKIRQYVLDLEPGFCMSAPWFSIWKSIRRYRVNSTVMSHSTIAFRDAPLLHWRSEHGYDQHHRNPYEAHYRPDLQFADGGTMHFQFADWRRIVAKHALYKMNEAWRWPGRKTSEEINRQYDATLNEKGVELAQMPFEWMEPYIGILQYLELNQKPWQEVECERLWKLHGPAAFEGLNLYGVIPQALNLEKPPSETSAPDPLPPRAPLIERPPALKWNPEKKLAGLARGN